MSNCETSRKFEFFSFRYLSHIHTHRDGDEREREGGGAHTRTHHKRNAMQINVSDRYGWSYLKMFQVRRNRIFGNICLMALFIPHR